MSNFLDAVVRGELTDKVVYTTEPKAASRSGQSADNVQLTYLARELPDPLLELWRTRERAHLLKASADRDSAAWAREIAALDAALGDYQPPVEPDPEGA